ncbi:MAG: hypothetical protein ACLFTT_06780 [Candidatus Hydrogenedentota bacterium]
MPENLHENPLYPGIVNFYRSEMERRYQLTNVRRFPVWAPLADEDIAQLRNYFLERIYPPAQVRREQDAALEAMHSVFRSSKRLAPLTGAALRSLWRLGRHAPAAVKAAIQTLDAYVEARRFERILLRNAVAANLTVRDTGERETMLRLLRTVPDREVAKLIEDMVGLFRLLANIPMLKAGVRVMDSVMETMRKKEHLYTDLEIHGVSYAIGMVRGGLELVDGHFDETMVEAVVAGIETVEQDWFDNTVAAYAPLPLGSDGDGQQSAANASPA